MSIYVDDVVFSSRNQMPQSFIDRLFGIIEGNGMLIKRQKVHNYKKESVKKITGVYVNGNKTRVANNKHLEFHTQYKYLKNEVKKINCIDEYYKIYNLYLKFCGNYQHIQMVEDTERYTISKKQFIKDKFHLSQLQDKYHQRLTEKGFDLERGIKGSDNININIKE